VVVIRMKRLGRTRVEMFVKEGSECGNRRRSRHYGDISVGSESRNVMKGKRIGSSVKKKASKHKVGVGDLQG
jgi:hypothetical protein